MFISQLMHSITGVEDNGEGEASLSKMEDRSWASEGCHVSNTTQVS